MIRNHDPCLFLVIEGGESLQVFGRYDGGYGYTVLFDADPSYVSSNFIDTLDEPLAHYGETEGVGRRQADPFLYSTVRIASPDPECLRCATVVSRR